MGVQGSVTSSTSQALVVFERDVSAGSGIAVIFGKSKINDIDFSTAMVYAHDEIVGFYISVDNIF